MPVSYVQEKDPGNAPTYVAPGAYSSKYQTQIDDSLNKVTNFKYDPLQDANYKALAKVYNANGERAAKNTMGDAAALNGGFSTSNAVSAAQQTRNQYNQELASYIPDLEEKAYNRQVNTLSAYRDADDTAYNRYRDDVSDKQWQYSQLYNTWKDNMSNYWNQKNYNLDAYKINADEAAAAAAASSGGGGGSYGGGGGYYGGGGSYYSGGGTSRNFTSAVSKARTQSIGKQIVKSTAKALGLSKAYKNSKKSKKSKKK